MSAAETMFSESWHRVAKLRVQLRPTAQVRRQYFRGERWYVLEDSFNNAFYRFREPVYRFLARLDASRTVDEIWQECLRATPNEAPGQPELIQLLAQLHQANLLQSDLPPDTLRLLERRQKRQQREWSTRLTNLFFLKFPVWNPNRWLDRLRPALELLYGRVGLLLWFVLVGAAVKVVIDRWSDVFEHAHGALSPDNFGLLYVAFVLTKGLHEFGHAAMCKRFGGEVHKVGVMLLFFSPVPYVDATSAWRFRERWKRVLVGAAGMINELALAAIATFIWANTGPGPLHALCYNVMFLASISTVLVNSNPFLRFDGYYIVSDLLDAPNLQQRAQQQLRYAFEHHVCGVEGALGPAHTRRDAVALVSFQLVSAVYRFVLYGGLLLIVADRFLGVGLVIASIFLATFLIAPLWKFAQYLRTNPALAGKRDRAWAISGGLAAALVLFLLVCPFPSDFRAPAALEAKVHADVFTGTSGTVDELTVRSGQRVSAGQVLMRLSSRELDLQMAEARAEREAALGQEQKAMQEASSIRTTSRRREAAETRVRVLEAQRDSLQLKAPVAGIWVCVHDHELPGAYIPRGVRIGEVVDPAGFRFAATVPQHDAARLFTNEIRQTSVRLFGEAGRQLGIGAIQIIPAEQRTLPTPALGWLAGGEMQVEPNDPRGQRTTEPFFRVLGDIEGGSASLLHGRSGQVRFVLPPEPLGWQWWRKVRQTIQERYRL